MEKKLPREMFATLVTPFNEDESINFDALKKLIDIQVESGMLALLIGSGTGGYHTMSMDERKAVIKTACEHTAGRIPIIAGIGCARPCDTIEMGKFAVSYSAQWGWLSPLTITRPPAGRDRLLQGSGRQLRGGPVCTTFPRPPRWSRAQN